jgi:hypothetical protein
MGKIAMLPRFIAVLLAAASLPAAAPEWQPLFDGKTLGGWRHTPFTGGATPRVENGAILLPAGGPLTGVTLTGAFPRVDYEVRFEAARLSGGDFFASLTFPVEDSFCTFVTGGWGGDIVGISSVNGADAANNETRAYFNFEMGRWYAFRLRVTAERIAAWIDERPVVDLEIAERPLGLRYGEIRLSAPLGFASYNTTGAVRKIEYRPLAPARGGR